MKTVVYQSYRTINVPGWIKYSMSLVEKWASVNGYEYLFIDDRMFDYVPQWYRQKLNNRVLPVSDLARLLIAKEFLSKGYDRTIWIDADLLLFDPDKFEISISGQFALMKEVWVEKNKLGLMTFEQKVCNAISVYTSNNSFLDFYIYVCQEIVKSPQNWVYRFGSGNKLSVKLERLKLSLSKDSSYIPSDIVGTQFLTQLYKAFDFQLIENTGLFSQILMKEIAYNKHHFLKKYIKLFGNKIYGANLCGSEVGKDFSEDIVNKVVDQLISTKGDVVNKYLE